MAFKEGVTIEQVNLFREFVNLVNDLDNKVYAGEITPDEAFDKATEKIEKTPVLLPVEKEETEEGESTKRTTAPKKK